MNYCVGGIKGGTGKTTVAMNLVVWLAGQGRKVLFVDADKQKTAADFTELRQDAFKDKPLDYFFSQMPAKTIYKQIIAAKDTYDDIVVDAGEGENPALRSALMGADVFIIPFQPAAGDIWTMPSVLEMLEQINSVRPQGPIKAFCFLNRTTAYLKPEDPRSTEYRQAVELLSSSYAGDIIFIPHPIITRTCYNRAQGSGLSIFDLPKTGQVRLAIKDLQAVFSFIMQQSII